MLNWCRVRSIYVPCVSQRYVMCALAVSGTSFLWMMYFSGLNTYKEIISHPLEHHMIFNSFARGRCFNSPIDTKTEAKLYVKVYWSLALQKSVKQVFWLAYAVSSLANGLIVDTVGARNIWGLGCLLAVVTSSILPLMVTVSPYAALGGLVFSGFGYGVMSPCCSVLVAHWAPENGRTTFVAFIESGLFLGLMLDLMLHEFISVWGETWETCLYVSCVLSSGWIMVWYTLFYNRPAQHPHMPSHQLEYLQTTTPGVQPFNYLRVRKTHTIPWKQILLSPPFLSLQLFNLAASWVHSILIYQTNQYMLRICNTRLMVVPGVYMTGMVLGTVFSCLIVHGWISDKLISKGLTSRTVNRRFFLLFSNYTSAGLLLAIPLLGCKCDWVLVVIFMLVYFQALGFSPLCANVVDLSPRYAGLLRGVLAASRVLVSVFCRQMVEVLVKDYSDRSSWAGLFYISAAILIILSFPYLCFGSGEIQEWNYFPKERSTQNGPVQSTAES